MIKTEGDGRAGDRTEAAEKDRAEEKEKGGAKGHDEG
jgi:hypothetical protein